MQQKHSSDKILLGSIVISMFLWGLSWPSGKILTRYCGPVNFAVYRYVLVVATLLLILLAIKTRIKVKKEGIPYIIASGVLLAVYSVLFFLGLKKGSPGAGGVLVTTLNPLMAYAIGIIIKRRLPSKNDSIGLVLGAIAGCVLLRVWSNPGTILDSGNLYFLLAATTWAIMSAFTAKGGKYGSSMSFSLWQYLVTLLCLLPLTDWKEMNAATHITDSVFWLNLVFSSCIVTAGATTVYFYATTKVGAEKASSYIFMVPLAAALSSWLFLGEHILIHTIIGGILGMCAVYVINKKKHVVTVNEME